MKRLGYLLGVVIVLAAFAAPAHADSFLLNIDHCTGGCGPAPYGLVTLTQAGTDTVDVNVVLYDNRDFVHAGFDGTFGFNIVGAPDITISNLSDGWTGDGTVAPSGNTLHFDGFGSFNYAVTWGTQGGGHGTPLALDFTVNAQGLTPDLFQLASSGGSPNVFFAADVAWANATGGVNTGAVGGSTPTSSVPEPATMLLLGTGLLGTAAFARRRRK